MSRLQCSVTNVTTGLSLDDEEKGALYLPSMGWGPHNRGPQVISFQWNERQMWPNAGLMSGDPSVPFGLLGQDARENDLFGPWSLGLGGHNSPYYLTGYCKDGSNNPIGGAIVQAFVTATDAFVAETTCDDRGFYQVPCRAPVAHYLVAYCPGSPDRAGSSVNTLVPARG